MFIKVSFICAQVLEDVVTYYRIFTVRGRSKCNLKPIFEIEFVLLRP